MYARQMFSLILPALMIAFACSAQAHAAASPITIQRAAVPAVYTPGQAMSVTLTINKDDTRNVTAIAVQETVPGTWAYQNVTSTVPTMIPIKSPADIPNADGTKTLSFYYISIPAFPITFTYHMMTGAADSGARSISGLAKFRFTGAEEQSPVVTTPVVATVPAEGETPTEGEAGTTTGTGCQGCNQTTKDFGDTLGALFPAALALLTLLALSRGRG